MSNVVLPELENTITYTRPWIADYQRAGIFCDVRYSIIEAGTKTGKTAGCILWLFEQALKGQAGQEYWWVAPVTSQAKIAFKRMRLGIEAMTQEGKGIKAYSQNLTDLTITLFNGATIWFKGSDKPDSLYGEDVYACVIDEASRCKEDSWVAVRSTLTATRAPIRIIGNVKGKGNWFYRLARMAQTGTKDMIYTKMTAYDAVDAGILSLAEVEDAKEKLPEHIFKELYLAEPSDDGGNPFGLDAIAKCVMPDVDESLLSGSIKHLIWDQGVKPDVWGWDLAKSTDYTVGIGMTTSGAVVSVVRFNRVDWPKTEEHIIQHTGGLPALVDATGLGTVVIDHLQEGERSNFEGFTFTSNSKQELMVGLAADIQAQSLSIPAGIVVLELEQFEFELTRTGVKYSAPSPLHDDCVCALALANKIRNQPKAWFYAS